MSELTYPKDPSSCMSMDGPVDHRFEIPGGRLLYNAKRDSGFPNIYEIAKHALVHSPEHIKRILIHVVDTSVKAWVAQANFVTSLSVPLGLDAYMDNLGLFICFPFFSYSFLLGGEGGFNSFLIHFPQCRSVSTGTRHYIVCQAT